MKIFSSTQIKDIDLWTINNESITSIDLMERAATECVNWIQFYLSNIEKFYIFCGNGNNGGDGFAIARLLYQKGYEVDVFADLENRKLSDDAQINFTRIREISGISIRDLCEVNEIEFNQKSTVIDAVFGIGLNRNLENKIKDVIENLNKLKVPKISIDIPSGLFADGNINKHSVIFKADYTLTFQFWKKVFLHPETGTFCGKIHLLDIGLSKEIIEKTATENFIISDEMISKIYQPRNDYAHKGNFGKSCIIAGSFGKIGAAILATKSAMKTGSGITFSLAPKCGYEALQSICPEAMYLYAGENYVNQIKIENDFSIGIGPGLGTDPETETALIEFLKNYEKPVVLDADALNLISKNLENLNLIPGNSVLTPHPKEFERLFGKTKNSFERLKLAQQKAKEFNSIIILKDHHTQIITPNGKIFYNITGNSGMAKGGSGDVLTGVITSFLAQNYTPENASIFGVWLHGKAGDFAAEKHSKEAMLASDLIDEIGSVFKIFS